MRLLAMHLITLLAFAEAGVQILAPSVPEGENSTLWAPHIDRFGGYGWVFPEWSGELVTPDSPRKQGLAVLLRTESGKSWETLIRREVEAGAAAIIIVAKVETMTPGGSAYVLDGTNVSDIRIPVVDIIQHNASTIEELLKNQSVFVRISCCDVSDWDVWNSSWVMTFWSVIITPLALLVFFLAFYKLCYTSYHNGIQLNIHSVCLMILCVSNIIRAFYAGIDPFETRKILTSLQANVLASITWPMTTLCMLLIALRWLELLTQVVVKVPKFLHRLFWPFVITAAVLMALELATSITRGKDVDFSALIYVTTIGYILIDLSVSIMFIYAGIRVIKQLTLTLDLNVHNRRSSSLILTTKLLIASVGCNLIFVITMILCATWIALEPLGWIIITFFIYVSLLSSDLFKALLLATARETPAHSSSGASGSGTTATAPTTQ